MRPMRLVTVYLCIFHVSLYKELAASANKIDDGSWMFHQYWSRTLGYLSTRGGGGKSVKTQYSQSKRKNPMDKANALKESKQKKKSGGGGEDGEETKNTISALVMTGFLKKGMKLFLGATVALYILNQKHMLQKPLSSKVSRYLFWPTLPITVSRRLGKWFTTIDENIVLGGAPLGFFNYPEKLYKECNVRGVINMCEEYGGPTHKYQKLGIEQLHLPTTDHFEPTVEDMKKAVKFIEKFKNDNGRVYVHCRAGHGRSAAIVFAYLIKKNPNIDLRKLNEDLYKLRDVRTKLWKQENILRFRSSLQNNKTD